MRVSRGWFALWVVDRAWLPQRKRVCALWPALEEFFDLFSDPHGGEARQKRYRPAEEDDVRIPKCGTWFVFKKWLSRRYDKLSKVVNRGPEFAPLRAAMVASHLMLYYGWIVESTREEHSRYGGIHVTVAYRNGAKMKYLLTCYGMSDVTATVPGAIAFGDMQVIYDSAWILAPWLRFVIGMHHDDKESGNWRPILQQNFLDALERK